MQRGNQEILSWVFGAAAAGFLALGVYFGERAGAGQETVKSLGLMALSFFMAYGNGRMVYERLQKIKSLNHDIKQCDIEADKK